MHDDENGNGEQPRHITPYPGGTLAIGDSAPMPRSYFEADIQVRVARLEARDELQALRIQSLVESRRTWRWVAGITAPVLIAAAIAAQISASNSVAASAERVGVMSAQIEAMRDELHNLRVKLDKLTLLSPPQSTAIVKIP